MGENGAAWKRCTHLHKDVLLAANSIYKVTNSYLAVFLFDPELISRRFKEMYGKEDGSLPATYQVLFMIGWRPGKDMPQPAKRGSATMSIKDISKLFTHEDEKHKEKDEKSPT